MFWYQWCATESFIKVFHDIHRFNVQLAQRDGELSKEAQPKLVAKLLQATLQTLALRARSGESKASLRKLARYAVDALVR